MKKKLSLWLAMILALEMLLGVTPITYAADTTPPQITSPQQNAVGVAAGSTIDLTFDEPVQKATTTTPINIVINNNGAPFDSIDVITNQVIVDPTYASKVSITLSSSLTLANSTTYDIQIPDGAFTDLAGNSILAVNRTFTTISANNVAPTIQQYIPAPSATGVLASDPLKVQFSEPVTKGTGSIRVKRVSDNMELQIDVSSSQVTIDPQNWVTINLSSPLQAGNRYYVLMDSGVFKDVDGTSFTGISNANDWTFTTAGGTTTSIQSMSPQNGATGVAKTAKLQLTFNRNVYQASGSIVIYKVNGGQLVKSIPVTSSQVTGGGTPVITIDPQITFEDNTQYYVTVSSTAFVDDGGNAVNGITGSTGWFFRTAGSSTPLTISSLTPSDGSVNVAVNSDLIINFNRAVQSGTGTVQVKKAGTNTLVPSTVTVTPSNPSEVRVKFSSGLEYGTTYIVDIIKDSFKDTLGNTYVGLNGSTNWSFKTVIQDKQAPVLQSAQMMDNTTIKLTYNELLDATVPVLVSNFTVTVNDEARKVTGVTVSGDSVYVYLELGVAVGQNVKISYSTAIRSIQDLAQNLAASFSQRQVTNSIDSLLPKPTDGYVSGSTLYLTFSNSLKSPSPYAYSQFNVTADGSSLDIKSISQSGSTIILYLDRALTDGQIVKVSYIPGSYPIQDIRSLNISAFTDYFVRNVYDTKPPVFTRAEGSDKKIVLTYNEALKSNNVPMKSQFSVLVNNAPVYVTDVLIQGNQVTLTVASSIISTTNAPVTISYVPGTGTYKLADLNGNAADYLNLQPVNITTSSLIPSIKTATVNGDTAFLVFTKQLTAQVGAQASQFVLKVDNVVRSLQSASISGDTVTLKLASPVTSGQTVLLSYTPASYPIKDSQGNAALAFTNLALQNGTNGQAQLPTYLGTEIKSDFGTQMATLKVEAASANVDRSRYGKSVQKYTIDSGKLSSAYDYIRNNVGTKLIVFEVPVSEAAADVSVPLKSLQDAYNRDGGTAFAVRQGDAMYSLPLKKINYTSLANGVNADISSVRLQIRIESVPANSSISFLNLLTKAGAQQITDPVEFDVSAVGPTNQSTDVDSLGDYYIRTQKSISSNKSTLVRIDGTLGKIAYVPTLIEKSGALNVLHGKANGNYVVAGVTGNKYYGDVEHHWAQADISELASKYIIEGRNEFGFQPNKYITRGEFATYITRALGLSGDRDGAQRFSDVQSYTDVGAYVGAAAKAGIISGNSDGSFKAGSYITREQMAIMLIRAVESVGYSPTIISGSPSSALSAYKDRNKIQSPEIVAKAVKEGFIQGVSANSFQPKGNATRAQAAVMIKRMLEKIGYM